MANEYTSGFLFVLTEKSSRHGDSIMRVNEFKIYDMKLKHFWYKITIFLGDTWHMWARNCSLSALPIHCVYIRDLHLSK